MKSATEIATTVSANMPSIGFLSKAKRIEAFNISCHMIEELAQDNEGKVDMERAAEAVEVLIHINAKFQKASYMSLLNFEKLPTGYFNELAYRVLHAGKYSS